MDFEHTPDPWTPERKPRATLSEPPAVPPRSSDAGGPGSRPAGSASTRPLAGCPSSHTGLSLLSSSSLIIKSFFFNIIISRTIHVFYSWKTFPFVDRVGGTRRLAAHSSERAAPRCVRRGPRTKGHDGDGKTASRTTPLPEIAVPTSRGKNPEPRGRVCPAGCPASCRERRIDHGTCGQWKHVGIT